jgi:sorbitol-specific phosphotransferase system component IIC
MAQFDADFVELCAMIFRILVLGVLPLTAVVILGIYIKKILEALGENRLRKLAQRGQKAIGKRTR